MQFDYLSVLQWLAGFLASAGGVWVVTQLVKKANSIPFIQEGQTPRVRAVAAALSALAVLILNVSQTGALDVNSVKDVLLKLVEIGIVWGGAHSIHEATTKMQ